MTRSSASMSEASFSRCRKHFPLVPEGATIILNASIAGSKGLPEMSVYCATKAAVRSFARTWTTDLKDRHIRVNAVRPRPHRHSRIERITRSRRWASSAGG